MASKDPASPGPRARPSVKIQRLTPPGASAPVEEPDDVVLVTVLEDDEPVMAVIAEDEPAPAAPVLAAADLAPATAAAPHDPILDTQPRASRLLGPKLAAALVTLLIHAVLLLLLGVIVITVPGFTLPEITAITAPEQVQEKPETKQIVVPQPTQSTSAVARASTSAISAVGVSPIALPEFDFKAPAEPAAEVATTDLGNSFSVAFQPKGTATVNFFGIKAKGRRIAFIVEAERYMLTDPKGGIPAYQIVKEEIASMIGKFGVDTAFNVMMFDHFHLSAFSDRLLPATSANIAKIRDWFYPINREFEKIGLATINYPPVKARTEVEPIKSKLLQGYMLAIQYALECDVDTVFIITSGYRWMSAFETQEEIDTFLKEQRWGEKEEKAWQAAVKQAQDWLAKENAARKAKGVPQRVVRSLNEIINELNIPVRHKPGLNIEEEDREKQILNAVRLHYAAQGKTKPQINFVLFVGKDEELVPRQEHFENIAQRARGGKVRILQGLAALKNVTGRE